MNKLIYKMELVEGSTQSISNLDYFILASGSDSRAYQVLSKLDYSSLSGPSVIIFHFEERLKDKDLTDDLFGYKKYPIGKLQEITCKIKSPSSSLSEFGKNKFDGSKKIGFDISCFTKPYFYYLIKLLRERFEVEKLIVFYTEPRSYLFPKGLFHKFHTSSGPLSIIEIPGYPGFESRDSKRKLVILLGFDGDLSKEINEDVSPNETVVVNGFPSYIPKFKDISLIANEKLVSDDKITIQYARANNPFEVYNLLESVKAQDGEGAFINVAPLGTKPMALGACLFALHNPDVRVVYPLPEMYEDKYSDDCWNSWMYDLPLKI
jgi:hypothetical protein